MRSAPAPGLGWLVLAGLTWGTSGTIGTFLRAETGLAFLAVAGYRIFVGGLLVLAFVCATRSARWPRTRAGWRRVAAIAAASALFQFGFFSALEFVGVAVATLVVIGATPLVVIAVEAATGHLRPTARLGLTLALALAGLALLAGAPAPTGADAGRTLTGLALALLASASFAAISLLGARPVADYDDATGTAGAFLAGGTAVLGVAAATGGIAFTPTPAALAWLLALGLVPSAVAYLAYFRGLRTQSSTTGALVSLLEPVTATVLATVVLGERLAPSGWVGAGLLVLAVALTTLAPRDVRGG
ncbi:DMT family transporter [Propioniciclava soli]|uniref:DMT family transporter n=1 Tax=Propioniciclava soli TaxID=2775081 RepID=A0ABZ3C6L9_9ACTN